MSTKDPRRSAVQPSEANKNVWWKTPYTRAIAIILILLILVAVVWFNLLGNSDSALNPRRLSAGYRMWLSATDEIDSCIEESIEEPAREMLADLMILRWFPRGCIHIPGSPIRGYSERRLRQNEFILANLVKDESVDLRTRIAVAYWARMTLHGAEWSAQNSIDWEALKAEAEQKADLPARYLLVFAERPKDVVPSKDESCLTDLHSLVQFIRSAAERDPDNGWYPYLEIYPWTWIRQHEASWQTGDPEKAKVACEELIAAMKRVVDSPHVVRELEPPFTKMPQIEGMKQASEHIRHDGDFLFLTVVRPEETVLKLTKDNPLPEYVLPVLYFDRKLLDAVEPGIDAGQAKYFESVVGSAAYGISKAAGNLLTGKSTESYRGINRDINDVMIASYLCRDLCPKLDRNTWELARKLSTYSQEENIREKADRLIALIEGQPEYGAREAYEKLVLFKPLMDAPALLPLIYAQYLEWLTQTVGVMSNEPYSGMDEDYTEARSRLLDTLNEVEKAVQARESLMQESQERWEEMRDDWSSDRYFHAYITISGLRRRISTSLDSTIRWAKQEALIWSENLEGLAKLWRPDGYDEDIRHWEAEHLLNQLTRIAKYSNPELCHRLTPVNDILSQTLDGLKLRHDAILHPFTCETALERRLRIAEQDKLVPHLKALIEAMEGHCPMFRVEAESKLNECLALIECKQDREYRWHFSKGRRILERILADIGVNGIESADERIQQAAAQLLAQLTTLTSDLERQNWTVETDTASSHYIPMPFGEADKDMVRAQMCPGLRNLIEMIPGDGER